MRANRWTFRGTARATLDVTVARVRALESALKVCPRNRYGCLKRLNAAEPGHRNASQMIRKCPGCGGFNVRRSSTRPSETTWRHGVFSRYRCRDCMELFWVISRKTYVVAAGLAVAIVVTAVVFAILGSIFEPSLIPPKGPGRSDGGHEVRIYVAAKALRPGARAAASLITHAVPPLAGHPLPAGAAHVT